MPTLNVTATTGPRALLPSVTFQVSRSGVSDLGELVQLENRRNPSPAPTSAHAGTRVAEQELCLFMFC